MINPNLYAAILVFCFFITTGCSSGVKGDNVKTIQTPSGSNYKIKIIDGCEYIEYDEGFFDRRVYSLTHKGNCKSHPKCQ